MNFRYWNWRKGLLSSKIVFKSLPDDDPKQRQPDITLAKEKLGWQPTVELEEGLKRMIEYFKNV